MFSRPSSVWGMMDVREDSSSTSDDSGDCQSSHAASSDDESVEPCTVDCPVCSVALQPWGGRVCFCCLSRFCVRCVDQMHTTAVPGQPDRRLSERCPVCREPVACDDATAVAQLSSAVARGNADAQSALGDHYMRGAGVRRDDARAKALYEQAAAQGHARAMAKVAYMHEFGRGGVAGPDYATAVALYTRAARLGFPDAQYNLGFLVAQGRGHARDEAKAARLYARAAASGHVNAQFALAIAHKRGAGVDQSDARAREWCESAAAAGFAPAREALDVGSFDGKGEADVGAASPSRRFGSRLPPLPRIGRLRNPFA